MARQSEEVKSNVLEPRQLLRLEAVRRGFLYQQPWTSCICKVACAVRIATARHEAKRLRAKMPQHA